MQNEISGLLQQVAGNNGGGEQVAQAAEQHLSNVPASEVQQKLQTAADNAESNGNGDLAGTIRALLAQHGGGEGLKQAAINLIKSNPQILQQFEPSFAKDILSRI